MEREEEGRRKKKLALDGILGVRTELDGGRKEEGRVAGVPHSCNSRKDENVVRVRSPLAAHRRRLFVSSQKLPWKALSFDKT